MLPVFLSFPFLSLPSLTHSVSRFCPLSLSLSIFFHLFAVCLCTCLCILLSVYLSLIHFLFTKSAHSAWSIWEDGILFCLFSVVSDRLSCLRKRGRERGRRRTTLWWQWSGVCTPRVWFPLNDPRVEFVMMFVVFTPSGAALSYLIRSLHTHT